MSIMEDVHAGDLFLLKDTVFSGHCLYVREDLGKLLNGVFDVLKVVSKCLHSII